MRNDQYKHRLAGILKAAVRIQKACRGLSGETFLRDRAAVASVREDLQRIGQAVDGLSGRIRQRYPAVGWSAWPAAAGTGDDALWRLATEQVPELAEQVNRVLLDITD